MALDQPTPDSSGGGEDASDENPKDDKELLEEALENYKLAEEAWGPNQKGALEDMKFRSGDHWPEKIKAQREKDGRPTLVVDKLNQYVRQIVNDGRQNRPAVKVRPIDDNGDEEIAEALQGIIRHICDRSNADEAFDTALESAVVGGFGFFRVLTEYAHEQTFDQEIAVGRIRNSMAVMLDPNAQKADGSDARWGFVVDEMTKDEFKKKYPKAKFVDWKANSEKYSGNWMTGENVRVAEYWYKVEAPGKLHLLADGTSTTDEDLQRYIAENPEATPPEILETREIPLDTVKWCRMSGAEILEKQDWLGKYIPIVPVYGNEYDIDGKVVYSGLIRAAKDAQRLYDFARSAYAEYAALQPKAPFIAAAGQVEGHPEWNDANQQNYSVLTYDPVDANGTSLPPPQRVQPPTGATVFSQDMQISAGDIQSAMGMYQASLGQPSNEKSGKAIMARQREGDTSTFHYQDNLNRAIRYLGRILVDLIPKIYDSQRVIRMLGEDGESSPARIDPNQQEAVQRMGGQVIYNLNIGTYDVSIASGPSYTTKRQETADAMMQLVQANPAIFPIIGDILVRNMDWAGADDIADRMKIMLPPPIQQAEQAKESGQDPKVLAAVAPLQQGLQQAHQQIQAAEQGIQQRDQAMAQLTQENQTLKADRAAAQQKALTDQYNAETARMKAQAESQNQPVDNSQLEFMRLDYEDKWKKLQAETSVIVAQIGASKGANGSGGQLGPDGQPVDPNAPAEPVEAEPDTNQVLAAAMEGFTQALGQLGEQMRQPRTVLRGPDGRVSGIQ